MSQEHELLYGASAPIFAALMSSQASAPGTPPFAASQEDEQMLSAIKSAARLHELVECVEFKRTDRGESSWR